MSTDKHAIGLLLSKIALRDRKAFEALYQLTSSRLYNLILHVVRDEHIAADVLQMDSSNSGSMTTPIRLTILGPGFVRV